MSQALHISRGTRVFIKSTLLMVLFVALFAIVNYNWNSATNTNASGDDGEREKRDADPNTDEGDNDLNTGPYQWDTATYPNNPCKVGDAGLFCAPKCYVMGIQFSGLNIVSQALGLHPKIDSYHTRFFSGFDDMEDIEASNMDTYFSKFDATTQKIAQGDIDVSICDSGRDLARPYALTVKDGNVSPPHHTTASALTHMYNDMQAVVVYRGATTRFYREFCSQERELSFVDYVNKAIDDFETCESDGSRIQSSCLYDASLSSLLQAGLYDDLFNDDLQANFVADNYFLIKWEELENTNTRYATMNALFDFLDKDTPNINDPYWGRLADLFLSSGHDYCYGAPIPPQAEAMLNEFYAAQNAHYN